jgi:hypothetical protein
MSGNHYSQMFILKMYELGYEEKDFNKFKYIGSSKKGILAECWKHLENILPKKECFCLCTKEIKENCYIYNQENKEIYVIGNHCINRFIGEKATGKRCDRCGDRHRNSKDNNCNTCRLIIEEDKQKKALELKNEKYKYYKVKCKDCFKDCSPYVRCYSCNQRYKKKCNDYNNNRQKYYLHTDS